MASPDPGNVIREVVDRRHTGERMRFTIRLKDEAKVGVIPVAIASLSERLACIPIAEVVYPIIADCPRVTCRQAPRVAPNYG